MVFYIIWDQTVSPTIRVIHERNLSYTYTERYYVFVSHNGL